MEIRLTDGTVHFGAGSIGPEITRTKFLGSALGNGADVLVRNDPYVTYRFRPEKGIVASASFVGDRLSKVSWLIELTPEKESEWTEKLELERKQLHDNWLQSHLGLPPYSFPWGKITSTYDPKGCVSDIILRYES